MALSWTGPVARHPAFSVSDAQTVLSLSSRAPGELSPIFQAWFTKLITSASKQSNFIVRWEASLEVTLD